MHEGQSRSFGRISLGFAASAALREAFRRKPAKFSEPLKNRASPELVRQRMEEAANGCDSQVAQARNFQYKLLMARTPEQMWLLRSDLYSLISLAFTQQEAARRVNGLLPCFEGWIAERQLSAI